MNIRIPFYGRLMIDGGKPYGHPVAHSPKGWPWWKFFKLSPVPATGSRAGWRSFNVWLYTRNDAVCCFVCLARKVAA